VLVACWLLGVLLLAPTLTRPTIAIALAGAVVAVWLAWKSVAYPLALAGIPALVAAILGSNPLPKGGATFLVGSWIVLAIAIATMRGRHVIALRGLTTLPVALAVLLLGLMLLRLGTSADEAYGSTKLQLYMADNLVFIAGAVFVGANPRSLRLFFLLTLAVVAAGALLLIVQLASGAGHQAYSPTSGRFTINAQQGSINLGRDSANGALIAICVIMLATREWVRVAALAALPALLVALIAAGSRGPTVAFVVGLFVLLTLTAATGRARRQLIVVGSAIVAAAILVPVVVPGSAISRSLSTIIGSSSGLSSNGRSSLWAEAFSAFNHHPLLGIGTGGFGSIDPQELYPHNIVLEVSVELGVLGLAALLGMLIAMAQRLTLLWQQLRGARQLEVTLLIALFSSALVNAMFSGAIQDNSDLWLWGGLGLGMFALHESAQTIRRRVRPLGLQTTAASP
jgi:O-antigen ligase